MYDVELEDRDTDRAGPDIVAASCGAGSIYWGIPAFRLAAASSSWLATAPQRRLPACQASHCGAGVRMGGW